MTGGFDVAGFRQDGFTIARGMFSGDELAALHDECGAQIDAGAERGPAHHFGFGASSDGSPVLFRIDAVIGKRLRNDSTMAALAHPGLAEAVAAILGPVNVCWSDALLWKGATGGAAVIMHSGHGWNDTTVTFENLVVDVYLDEASPANGCLKVIPGSHRLTPEENRALVALGFDAPGMVDVPMAPGDVLFHSEWMVHGSLPTPPLGRTSRRILYLAYRHPDVFRGDDSPEQRRRIAACFRRQQLAVDVRAALPYGSAAAAPAVPDEWAGEVASVSDDEALAVGHFADIVVPTATAG